jgi:hypothetical protein
MIVLPHGICFQLKDIVYGKGIRGGFGWGWGHLPQAAPISLGWKIVVFEYRDA